MHPTPSPTKPPTPSPTKGSHEKITDWLEELIAEANAEIETIRSDIKKAESVVNSSKISVATALTKEGIANTKKIEARRVLSAAEGKRNAVCNEKSEAVPDLTSEIGVFEKVIVLLQGLSNGKELVEEDQKKVSAFISLADQADPKKVSDVIELVRGLIATAKAEIVRLTKNCAAAEAEVVAAEKAYNEAEGVWTVCVRERKDAESKLERDEGKLETAIKHAETRIPQLREEIVDLEAALELILSLA